VGVKISIIGAGSAVFSLSLIKDLCLTANLTDSRISLMDNDPERLDAAFKLCTRYAQESGRRFLIEKTTDRKHSLQGADFVINTALAAGHDRLRKGWEVAFRHGYRFGGSLHIVHDEAFWVNFFQLQLMESIMRDISDICPESWFVLVANPVLAGVTYLSRKYRGAKIVGMCHGYGGVYNLASVVGINKVEMSFEIPGVNHFVWLNRLDAQGHDAFPLLKQWIEKKADEYFSSCPPCDHMGPKAVDLYRRFGVFPIGDTGNPGGGCWGYWYHKDRKTEKKWKEDPYSWYGAYFKDGLRRVTEIRRIASDSAVRVTEAFSGLSGEPMIPLIEALACNVERTVIVNVMNTENYVEGVPLDFEVEIPATVNGSGIFGRKTKQLPAPVLSFLHRDRIVPVELELQAYDSGCSEYLLDLILMDPWTKDGDQASRLKKDIFSLPFNEEMRKHYCK
jgi:alpha-galactosidase